VKGSYLFLFEPIGCQLVKSCWTILFAGCSWADV